MGLDIYLYTEAQQEANDEYERASNALYDRADYESLSLEDKEQLSDALPPWQSSTDVPSQKYPQHLCNRRYLRSSYNSGGFNTAVPELTGYDHGLYWIFQPLDVDLNMGDIRLTNHDVEALEDCRKRAEQVASEIDKCDALRTLDATSMMGSAPHMWSSLPSEEQVLEWYREERGSKRSIGSSYSCAKGLVLGFDKGTEILALTIGQRFGEVCAIAVFRMNQESLDHYRQTAEIITEFCEEAIALIEQDGAAYISWSG